MDTVHTPSSPHQRPPPNCRTPHSQGAAFLCLCSVDPSPDSTIGSGTVMLSLGAGSCTGCAGLFVTRLFISLPPPLIPFMVRSVESRMTAPAQLPSTGHGGHGPSARATGWISAHFSPWTNWPMGFAGPGCRTSAASAAPGTFNYCRRRTGAKYDGPRVYGPRRRRAEVGFLRALLDLIGRYGHTGFSGPSCKSRILQTCFGQVGRFSSMAVCVVPNGAGA
ncbi:hypothetical protein ABIC21_000559 [Pseudarthrobacter sp. PvP090]